MNKIVYANFSKLYASRATSGQIDKRQSSSMKNVFAGMWPLTVLTKEGFAGLKKLQEGNDAIMTDEEIRRQVMRTLQEDPITNPQEEKKLAELRSYVRSTVKGMFR